MQVPSSRSKVLFVMVVGLTILFTWSIPLRAQVVGARLTGTVTDSSGGAISGAQIAIKNVATGVVNTVTSDSVGFYSEPNLAPGNYEVTVTANGFSTSVRAGLTLTVGAQQLLNLAMQVGQMSQTIEVT